MRYRRALEIYVIGLEIVVDRIVLSCPYLKVHIGEERAKDLQIDSRVPFQLEGDIVRYLSQLIRDVVYAIITREDDP